LIVCQISFYLFFTCFLILGSLLLNTYFLFVDYCHCLLPCGCSLFVCFFIVYLCHLLTCALHVHHILAYVSPIHLHVASLGTHQTFFFCLLVACFLAYHLLLCGTTSFHVPTCVGVEGKNKEANFH